MNENTPHIPFTHRPRAPLQSLIINHSDLYLLSFDRSLREDMCNTCVEYQSEIAQLSQAFDLKLDLAPSRRSTPRLAESNGAKQSPHCINGGWRIRLLNSRLMPFWWLSRSFNTLRCTGGSIESITKQRRWLVFMRHCSMCDDDQCHLKERCDVGKRLWRHVESCADAECRFPHCAGSKCLLAHHEICASATCPVCVPVRDFVAWETFSNSWSNPLPVGQGAPKNSKA